MRINVAPPLVRKRKTLITLPKTCSELSTTNTQNDEDDEDEDDENYATACSAGYGPRAGMDMNRVASLFSDLMYMMMKIAIIISKHTLIHLLNRIVSN